MAYHMSKEPSFRQRMKDRLRRYGGKAKRRLKTTGKILDYVASQSLGLLICGEDTFY
ncbi:hypothetical protein CEP53_010371 [Fusarium sp. AF-6]|nr:hypothetical protein CEP53_010371 [Fusarium sp. AF-6]